MATVVKAEHVNPFLMATIETFKAMMGTEIHPGKMMLGQNNKIPFDISGIIGLSGGARGSVSLSFPRITALKAVSEFAGTKVVSIDESVVENNSTTRA